MGTTQVIDDEMARAMGDHVPEHMDDELPGAPVHGYAHEVEVMGQRLPPATQWIQPGTLTAPESRPGFTQRWVYVGYGTEAQNNLQKRLAEGWRPRAAATAGSEYTIGRLKDDRFVGAIVQGDSCLMEMENFIFSQKRKHVLDVRQAHAESIGMRLKEMGQERGMDVYKEDDTEITTGQLPE